jgi:hypothetical protein
MRVDKSGALELSGDGFFADFAAGAGSPSNPEFAAGVADVFAAEVGAIFAARIEAWAIMTERSGVAGPGVAGFLVEGDGKLETFDGCVTNDFETCVAFEARTAAWTIMADKSDPEGSALETSFAGTAGTGALPGEAVTGGAMDKSAVVIFPWGPAEALSVF